MPSFSVIKAGFYLSLRKIPHFKNPMRKARILLTRGMTRRIIPRESRRSGDGPGAEIPRTQRPAGLKGENAE